MIDFIFEVVIIACFLLCSWCCVTRSLLSTHLSFRQTCVCMCVCMCICVCTNVLCNLVRFVTARGSLLCERMPVLHFLPFVLETLKPVFEPLSACVDAQLHSTCSGRGREGDRRHIGERWETLVAYKKRQKPWEIKERCSCTIRVTEGLSSTRPKAQHNLFKVCYTTVCSD